MRTKRQKESHALRVRRRALRIEIAPSTLLAAVLIVCAVWLLIHLIPVLLVLILSLMIVGTLNPAVEWLERHKLPRNAAIAVTFGLFLVIIALPLALSIPALISQVASLIEQEPHLRSHLIEFLSSHQATRSLADYLRELHYETLIKSFGAQLFAYSTHLITVLAYSAGAVFLALYIMIDRDRLRGGLFAIVPREHHIRLSRILINLETIVGGYLRGQAITCLLMGLFLYVLLASFGVPNALAFAVFGAIADVLPFIGAFLTMGPAVLASLSKGMLVTGIIFVALLIYEEFESRFLIPLVYGKALRLPSSVVLFSLITGGSLYGITGALLALPVAATILMLIDELRVELPGEQAQPDNVETREQDELSEAEYKRRTEGMSAEKAAAVAVEMTGQKKSGADSPQQNDGPDKDAGQ